MIVVETGTQDAKSFDAKILFASQLARLGYSVGIDENTLPEDLDRSQKFELAPYLTRISEIEVSGLVVIGAENISDETMMLIRSYKIGDDIKLSATGRFEDYQALIGSSSKIAYATGREANVVDLNDLQKQQLLTTSISPLAASDTGVQRTAKTTPELFVYLTPEGLEDPLVLPVLGAMDHLAGFNLNIVIAGIGKEQIRKSKYATLSVYGIAEFSPATFAAMADVAAFFGEGVPGERMACFALDLMRSAGVVIDCTQSAGFVSSGAPVLRGPEDLTALANYLQNTVLTNLNQLGLEAQASEWIESNSFERLETALELPVSAKNELLPSRPSRTMFMPTNGNGLGHAQRCSLIASELKDRDNVAFAAFPSCINLINDKGFRCVPLVQKSDLHAEDYANDLVNYLRLNRTLRRGDQLVFDGGYVFDSVYRTIVENGLSATWIRRGLWRAGQIRESAFGRETAFQQVIVPSEAFDELNTAYTFGPNIHTVGPVLQSSDMGGGDIESLRSALADNLGHDFDELVVTMLGGGVAVDRSAQMQTLAALLERRPDCLHLVVVWPGSKLSNGLSGWKNTRVVKTRNALKLCQSADLVVSAAGYNSFHEILYHGIPSILIPQMAPFMDDQERRARAASERGLASTVLGHEMLMLERELTAHLDGGKSASIRQALEQTAFPARGNGAAARIIEKGLSNE